MSDTKLVQFGSKTVLFRCAILFFLKDVGDNPLLELISSPNYNNIGQSCVTQRSLVPKVKISLTTHVQLLQLLHGKQQQQHNSMKEYMVVASAQLRPSAA